MNEKSISLKKSLAKCDFVSLSRYTIFFSLGLFVLGLFSFLFGGGFRYGIDFSGGSHLEILLESESSPTQIKKILKDKAEVYALGKEGKKFLIKNHNPSKEELLTIQSEFEKEISVLLKTKLKTNFRMKAQARESSLFFSIIFPDAKSFTKGSELLEKKLELFSSSVRPNIRTKSLSFAIGWSSLSLEKTTLSVLRHEYPQMKILEEKNYESTFGRTLKKQSVFISFLVLILILLYIGVRFQFKYGIAAITALIHDIFAVLSIILIFRQEVDITTVIALLTIMGYSLNDTIVVFDRIRENREALLEQSTNHNSALINRSVYQSLSRTLITSLTTLFVIACLLFFGGDSLQNLSFALFIGVSVGTYSSIFIASPALIFLETYFVRAKKVKKNA